MGRLAVFLGGVSSGKSDLAQSWLGQDLRVAYLASVSSRRAVRDAEMQLRILAHRRRRPAGWVTLECGKRPVLELLRASELGCRAAVLDGLGLWVASQLRQRKERLQEELEAFCAAAKLRMRRCALVLDEAGLGGVPARPLARRWIDINGSLNRRACELADEVRVVFAGFTCKVKG